MIHHNTGLLFAVDDSNDVSDDLWEQLIVHFQADFPVQRKNKQASTAEIWSRTGTVYILGAVVLAPHIV